MSERKAPPRPSPLLKQLSWSPDAHRDEAWSRRRMSRHQRSKSVTEEDLEELKACFELGFGFDSPEVDQKLSETFPALELYYAGKKQYRKSLSRSSSTASWDSGRSLLTASSDCDRSPRNGSPSSILDPGDDPKIVRARLRQWAQVVACSVRQSSPN